MAEKGKYVKAEMWEDEWYDCLLNHEKLIWLYLLTSKARVMSGIITAKTSEIESAINPKPFRDENKRINKHLKKHKKIPDDIIQGFMYYDEDDIQEILKRFEKEEKIIVLKDSKYLLVNYYKHQDFDNQSMLQKVIKDLISITEMYGEFFTNKIKNNKSFYNSLFVKIENMIRSNCLPRDKCIDQDKWLISEIIKFIRLIPGMFKNREVLSLSLRYMLKNKLMSEGDINEIINITEETPCPHTQDTLSALNTQCPDNKTKLNQIKLNQTKLKCSLGLSNGLGTGSAVAKNQENTKSDPTAEKKALLEASLFFTAMYQGEQISFRLADEEDITFQKLTDFLYGKIPESDISNKEMAKIDKLFTGMPVFKDFREHNLKSIKEPKSEPKTPKMSNESKKENKRDNV